MNLFKRLFKKNKDFNGADSKKSKKRSTDINLNNPVNAFFNDKDEKSGKQMSFIDHLDELRKRLLVVFIVFFILFIAYYPFHAKILGFLTESFIDTKLIYLEIMEPFLVNIKISFFCAVITVSPLLFYHITAFISPALSIKIKKYMAVILVLFFILFAAGFFFAYKLLVPVAVSWLMRQGNELQAQLSVSKYISFVGWFLTGAGIAFELPLILLFLIKAGVLKIATLRRQWRIVYIAILLLSAVITPDWSPVTMAVLAVPMILLYELSLLLAKLFK